MKILVSVLYSWPKFLILFSSCVAFVVWGFSSYHGMLMPKLSLNIFLLEHFIQELQGKKWTFYKSCQHKALVFSPSFAVSSLILPEEHPSSEAGTCSCHLHRQCFLGSVPIRSIPPNGFSFFHGRCCQIPHLAHVIELLLIFLGKYKYTNNISGTAAAAFRFFLELLSL